MNEIWTVRQAAEYFGKKPEWIRYVMDEKILDIGIVAKPKGCKKKKYIISSEKCKRVFDAES